MSYITLEADFEPFFLFQNIPHRLASQQRKYTYSPFWVSLSSAPLSPQPVQSATFPRRPGTKTAAVALPGRADDAGDGVIRPDGGDDGGGAWRLGWRAGRRGGAERAEWW